MAFFPAENENRPLEDLRLGMCAPIKMNFLFEKEDRFLKLVRLVTIRTKCYTLVTAYVHVFMAY